MTPPQQPPTSPTPGESSDAPTAAPNARGAPTAGDLAHSGEAETAAHLKGVAAGDAGRARSAQPVDEPTTVTRSPAAGGFRIGPYQVVRELGRGGMGVVYLARDPRLDRQVALKGITETFAADAELMARFQREARTLASLNHPHIAAIFGLEEHEGATYLVLELVEGPTLSERLREGPLGWEESCRVGVQMAQALEAAHQRGIIHRDLKPANVKFTAEGALKILDFGLAKQGAGGAGGPGAADMSITVRTEAGAIMGTPGYMSPEQARGQPVDRRCDIWAFGCILYECLTGRRTYTGPTATDAIAATLMLDPDWSHVPAGTPQRLEDLLRHCLKKQPDERLKDIGEARLELSGFLAGIETAAIKARPAAKGQAAPAAAGNLPRQITSFVGRETELAQIAAMIEDSSLVTLAGAGGCGKTRLAIEAARTTAARFSDGVHLVELAALTDGSLVVQACADALGIREEGAKSLDELLRSSLSTRSCLIVLDNCEHVLEAAARLVDTILKSCPRVHVVATSREALGISGESTFRVPSLPTPDARFNGGASDLAKFGAVQLLVERVRAVSPGFALTDANAGAVAKICQRLDGIPLAIELVAARFKAMTPEQISQRLGEAFRLLTGGSRTALPRQQTLRALIDWSYGLLSENERVMLRRLSVFAGGWRLESAERVCAGEAIDEFEVADLLTHLVDKSLVTFEPEREGDGSGSARYRMLETVRQYSRDKLLESGEGSALRTRHLDYYLSFAEECDKHMRGAEQGVWIRRLEAEHDNLRAASEWCTAEGGEGVKALRLGAALFRYWWSRGYLTEGRAHMLGALAADTAAAATPVRATVLHAAGWIAKMQGDLDAAKESMERSVAIRREIGDKAGLAGTLNALGLVAQSRGDLDEAMRLYEDGLAIQREIGNKRGIAGTLLNLGVLALHKGDVDLAERHWSESLEVYRAAGDRLYTAGLLCNLGNAAMKRKDLEAARSRYRESLRLFREYGSGADVALLLEGFSGLALACGMPRRGAVLLGAGAAMRDRIGAPIPNEDRAEHERHVAALRAAMDQAEGPGGFEACAARGRAWGDDAAIADALGEWAGDVE